ncbi:TPA: M16 family metallopeptidase [Pseudomonas putida]
MPALTAKPINLINPPSTPLQHVRLENGLRVYLQRDQRSPLVCAQLHYHVGSSHEAPGHSNLSHVLEHMVFEGSGKLAAGQYLRVINWLGGTGGASTFDDATVYKMTLPASRLEVGLEIMAESMVNARLDDEAFEKAKTAVRDERRLKIDNQPVQQALESHGQLAHQTSPYAIPNFGDPQDLEEMSLSTIRAWYRSRYAPNNATLVVVGDIELSRLEEWVQRHFAGCEAIPLQPTQTPRHPEQLAYRQQTLTLPNLHDGLLMSFNVPSLATAESSRSVHALRIVAELLGRGAPSLLHDKLVRKRQVLTGIGPSYDYQVRGDTLLTLSGYVAPGNTPASAEEAVLDIIESVQRTPFTAQQIEDAKLHLLAQHAEAQANLTGQADALSWRVIGGLDPTQLHDEFQTLASLTEQDIQLAIKTYLTRERLAVTHMCAPKATLIETPVLTCIDLATGSSAVDLSGLTSAQGLSEAVLDTPEQEIQQWHTELGSKVCFVPVRGAPAVDLQLCFKAGAYYDGNTPGLAAMTLHMLSQGCDQLDAVQLASQLRSLGATLKRYVTHDDAILRLRGPFTTGLYKEAVALLAAMSARPSFEATALEGMRTRVINYLRHREAKPENRLDVERLRNLYDSHPYTLDSHGTARSVMTISRQQIVDFHQWAYGTGNLEITLAGDLSRADAEKLVNDLCKALPVTQLALPAIEKARPSKQARTLHIEQPSNNPDTDNVKVSLAFAVEIQPGDTQFPALTMANQILGASFESRLVCELREQRSLTYAVRSYFDGYRGALVLIVGWDIKPHYLQASIDLVKLVLHCFIEQGPSEFEMQLARNQLCGDLLRTLADDQKLVDLLAQVNASGLPADHFKRFQEQLAQTTVTEIQAVARQVFESERCVVTCVGPKVKQQPLPARPLAD